MDNDAYADRLAAVEREVAVVRARVDGLDGRFAELSRDLKALALDLSRMWHDLTEYFLRGERDRARFLAAALTAAFGGASALAAVILEHVL